MSIVAPGNDFSRYTRMLKKAGRVSGQVSRGCDQDGSSDAEQGIKSLEHSYHNYYAVIWFTIYSIYFTSSRDLSAFELWNTVERQKTLFF